jgi:hypothetical protein
LEALKEELLLLPLEDSNRLTERKKEKKNLRPGDDVDAMMITES